MCNNHHHDQLYNHNHNTVNITSMDSCEYYTWYINTSLGENRNLKIVVCHIVVFHVLFFQFHDIFVIIFLNLSFVLSFVLSYVLSFVFYFVRSYRWCFSFILWYVKYSRIFLSLFDLFLHFYSCHKNNCQKIQPAHYMITKRDFILRGNCFC